MLKKKDGTTDTWAIIIWIVIIIFVILGIYNLGKSSDKKLTPEEARQESARCYQLTGQDCQPYSAN